MPMGIQAAEKGQTASRLLMNSAALARCREGGGRETVRNGLQGAARVVHRAEAAVLMRQRDCCGALEGFCALSGGRGRQNEILRYSRLKVCATRVAVREVFMGKSVGEVILRIESRVTNDRECAGAQAKPLVAEGVENVDFVGAGQWTGIEASQGE